MPDKMSADILTQTEDTIKEYVGEFLAEVITRKAIEKVGAKKENLTVEELHRALDMHIIPALLALLSREKVMECRRKIETKIKAGA